MEISGLIGNYAFNIIDKVHRDVILKKTFESVQLLSLSDVVSSICNVKLIKVVRTLDVYINMPKEKKNQRKRKIMYVF